MHNADVDKHGGDDEPPISVKKHCFWLVGAEEQQLVRRGVPDGEVMEQHRDEDQAVDGDQHISGRRVGPGALFRFCALVLLLGGIPGRLPGSRISGAIPGGCVGRPDGEGELPMALL